MAAAPKKTGIRNADQMAELAGAWDVPVTVETTSNDKVTSHVVTVTIPVPTRYAGTELGRALAASRVTLLWVKPANGRARLQDATLWDATSHTKLRTMRDITAAIEDLGREAKQQARAASPMPADVIEAPHALYIDGTRRMGNIAADRIRTFVNNRRFKGLLTHQDDDGGIVCDNRRYVPEPAGASAPAPVEERMHVRTVDGGEPELIPTREALAEMNTAMMEGKRDVREMSSSQSTARITYRDGRTVDLRPAHSGDTLAVQAQRPTVEQLTGPIDDAYLAFLAETYAAVADGSAIPVRADMIRPGMDVIAAARLENRTVSTVHAFTVSTVHAFNGSTPWVSITWTLRSRTDSVMGDARVYEPGHHLMVTVESLERLYDAKPAPKARPAAEVLAADPIPADASVLTSMPGQIIGSEGKWLGTARDGMTHDDYVAQLRSSGTWILPNHDDQADITRSGVIHGVTYALTSAPARARASIDTDGTVYVSNGYQAARYIPAALIADYSADRCPGCDTPYATNGDGPCRAAEERAAKAERIRAAAARQARAQAVRGEAQALGTNQATAELARRALESVQHKEATEGHAGFALHVDHRAVHVNGVTAEGYDWPLLTEALRLHLEHAGWFAEPTVHGLRLTLPAGKAAEVVTEGRRRAVEAAHAEALATLAQV
ncbi:hypothetical protein ACIBAC_00640 [Streptomyces sp. NPDC051362]|uniref:hypothetical protein n=1 Tax=Streptomyces sp. NPDC051362 TaxID=3365651 RepID=UPI0037B20281